MFRPEKSTEAGCGTLWPLELRGILQAMSQASSAYVMGHNDRERRRLALQGAILRPFTEQFFRQAGISPGMHVLDVGCGVGDVSLIAAQLVGRAGRVTSIDIDPAALAVVRERAREQDIQTITTVQTSVDEYHPGFGFDAVVGRHILIHTADPVDVLRKVRESLNPGGVAAFQEFDLAAILPSYPVCALREQVVQFFKNFFCRAVHGDIGSRLFHLFLEAGFPAPQFHAGYPLDGGPESPFYEWIAESVGSILPRAQALGIVPDFDPNPETLADRLRDDAVALKACIAGPLMGGAFARRR
jgi:2-polyprenyl-3-methyl-5-hydroxy-6-metoxy-1,4-benzoquinol methylase